MRYFSFLVSHPLDTHWDQSRVRVNAPLVDCTVPHTLVRRYLRSECQMKVPPKRTTLLERIAKWGQVGVRPELLVYAPQAHHQALSRPKVT